MVIDKKLQGGEVLIVFFCVIAGAAQLGQMSPSFEAINAARGAAYHVFNISARVGYFLKSFVSCANQVFFF